MLIVHILVHVKAEHIDAFRAASIENASKSIREPGIERFEILQEPGDPSRFKFIEVYRTPEGAAAHKETDHYKKWRDTVEPMMAEPRARTQYTQVFP